MSRGQVDTLSFHLGLSFFLLSHVCIVSPAPFFLCLSPLGVWQVSSSSVAHSALDKLPRSRPLISSMTRIWAPPSGTAHQLLLAHFIGLTWYFVGMIAAVLSMHCAFSFCNTRAQSYWGVYLFHTFLRSFPLHDASTLLHCSYCCLMSLTRNAASVHTERKLSVLLSSASRMVLTAMQIWNSAKRHRVAAKCWVE